MDLRGATMIVYQKIGDENDDVIMSGTDSDDSSTPVNGIEKMEVL